MLIRLILPIFFFLRLFYKVQYQLRLQKNKIGKKKDVESVEKYPFHLQISFSKTISQFSPRLKNYVHGICQNGQKVDLGAEGKI